MLRNFSVDLSELRQVSMHYEPNDDALSGPFRQSSFDYSSAVNDHLRCRSQSLVKQCE